MLRCDCLIGFIIALIYFLTELLIQPFRAYFRIGYCRDQRRLDNKTIIVTGANTGVGYETTKECLRRGAKVIMACRDLKKGTEAINKMKVELDEKINVKLVQLDLASFASVRRFAKQINLEENRVDMLVNNAGGAVNKFQQTEDGNEFNFQVNYLSHFLLTMLLIDLIEKSNGKVINVSSILHYARRRSLRKINSEKHFHQILSYADSKSAQILFTRELAKRYPKVKTYALHPGTSNTGAFRYNSPLLQRLVKTFYATAYQLSQPVMHCICDETEESGNYHFECSIERLSLFYITDDLIKNMWNFSLQITQLNNNNNDQDEVNDDGQESNVNPKVESI